MQMEATHTEEVHVTTNANTMCMAHICSCVFFRSVLVKRMFRPPDEDLCPSPHKQMKEETHKRGTR